METFVALILGIIILCIAVAAYFLPTMIAVARKHNNATAIFALNLLLGWSFIGWVVSLVWSLTSNTAQQQTDATKQ